MREGSHGDEPAVRSAERCWRQHHGRICRLTETTGRPGREDRPATGSGIDPATADGGAVEMAQVFVSRTSDMAGYPVGRSFAQAVLDAVMRAGSTPVDMRYFAARDGRPVDYCRQ